MNSATVRTTLLMGALLASSAAAACTGTIGDPTGRRARGGPTAEGPRSPPASPMSFPLARLTRSQYANAVRDIVAPIVLPGDVPLPPADPAVSSAFEGNTATQTPSAGLVEAYHAAAVKLSAAVTADSALVLQYSKTPPTTRAEEDAAARSLILGFGHKAFRRPLSDAEVAKMVALYDATRGAGSDFDGAIRTLVQAFLQSAKFLYRVEVGTPIEGKANRFQLTPWEMASRLSFLLLNSTPDETLLQAAAKSELGSVESVESHARRLLADPRAHEPVLHFFRQWLRLDAIASVRKDSVLFPEFDAATASAMAESSRRRIDTVFFGDGSLRTLLSGNQVWVNSRLAPYYGLPTPGPDMKLVSANPTQRAGILTDVGLLSLLAHEGMDSPIKRGVYVLDRLACSPPAPPPPNVGEAPPPIPSQPKTTRERLELVHEQGSCGGCHRSIDGVGFAFGHYDAVGKWRATEFGLPIDDSGRFVDVGDLEGTFVGAVELGQRLAESRTVQTCVASNWMRFALGIDNRGLDATQLSLAVDAFTAKNLDMRELVIALVKSDAFRTRFQEP